MGGAEWVGLGAGAVLYEGHFTASGTALTAARLLAPLLPSPQVSGGKVAASAP